MPYANNNGVKIYYEVEGHGIPLVLAQGAGPASLNTWRRYGWVDGLKDDYQLVLYDARGHGRSDKPHEASAYGMNWVYDVLAVLNTAGISKAHFLGYSIGAWVGFWLAARHSARFYSFILGCMTPYTTESGNRGQIEMMKQFLSDPVAGLMRQERMLGRPLTLDERSWMLTRGTEVFSLLLTNPPVAVERQEQFLGRPLTPEEKVWLLSRDKDVVKLLLDDPAAAIVPQERLLGRPVTFTERAWMVIRDIEAMIALLTSTLEWPTLTNDDLAGISLPCLVYCGDKDPRHDGAKESAGHMPNSRFVSLPGIDHAAAWARSDLVLPHVKEFLTEVSKT
jgi:pimeloyl-ACP methyl ester carboxylesterase